MSMGVTPEEFWNGDYTMLKYKVQKHQKELEQQNFGFWLQGRYFYEALVAVANSFGNKDGRYPEKPHRITPMDEQEKEAAKQEQIENFRAQLTTLCGMLERKHKRGENNGSR